METETQRILSLVEKDPSLRSDPGLLSSYQKAGGTLSNYMIPVREGAKPVSVVSTDKGVEALNKAKEAAQRLTPVSQPTGMPATVTPSSGAAPTETKPSTTSSKVSLINPTTGQSVTFDDASINQSNIRSYLSSGYELESASGQVPEWLTPKGVATPAANTALDTAKEELASVTSKLKNFDVSNDPALQSILGNITNQWDSRIREMENANKSRLASLSTTGTRLGSRYTGGAGGVFGGIISAEERQGVDRISDLQSKKQQALAEAKTAYEKGKWDQYVKLVDIAQKNYDKQIEEVKELNKIQAESTKKISESIVQSKKDTAIATLLDSGVTDPLDILTSLNKIGFNTTADDIGKAIKNLVPEAKGDAAKLTGDFNNFYTLKKMPNALPASITSLPESEQLGAFIKWNQDLTTSKKAVAEGNNATPINFDQFSREQIALSVIPVQLRNSDAEMKRYIDGIRMGLGEGKTPYQIADELMGYKVTKPDDFSDSLRQLFPIANLDQAQIQGVARFINSGNKVGAISLIENQILENQKKVDPDSYVGEGTPRYYAEKVSEINNLIKENGLLDAIGPLEGTVSMVFGKLPFGKRLEAAKVEQKVTSLVSEMRNHLSGTSVTESEKKFLEPLIAKLTDKKGIFLSKINEIRDDSLLRHNQVRKAAGLPALNVDQLVDKKKRVDLYATPTFTEGNSVDTDIRSELDALDLSNIQAEDPTDFWSRAK